MGSDDSKCLGCMKCYQFVESETIAGESIKFGLINGGAGLAGTLIGVDIATVATGGGAAVVGLGSWILGSTGVTAGVGAVVGGLEARDKVCSCGCPKHKHK